MIKLVALSCVLIVVLLGSTESKTRRRIFRVSGGQPVTVGQFPFLVSLQLDKQHICGGTIISKSVVLTAAHCLRNQAADRISILAGTINRNSGGVRIQSSRLIPHPDYIPHIQFNDIGLVHLSSPLTYNETIQPAVLPSASEGESIRNCEGCMATVIGWGQLGKGKGFPDIANYVGIPIAEKEQCFSMPDIICAGGLHSSQNSCPGDSGGPLAIGNKVIGSVIGSVACEHKSVAFYTNLAVFESWIAENSL